MTIIVTVRCCCRRDEQMLSVPIWEKQLWESDIRFVQTKATVNHVTHIFLDPLSGPRRPRARPDVREFDFVYPPFNSNIIHVLKNQMQPPQNKVSELKLEVMLDPW